MLEPQIYCQGGVFVEATVGPFVVVDVGIVVIALVVDIVDAVVVAAAVMKTKKIYFDTRNLVSDKILKVFFLKFLSDEIIIQVGHDKSFPPPDAVVVVAAAVASVAAVVAAGVAAVVLLFTKVKIS